MPPHPLSSKPVQLPGSNNPYLQERAGAGLVPALPQNPPGSLTHSQRHQLAQCQFGGHRWPRVWPPSDTHCSYADQGLRSTGRLAKTDDRPTPSPASPSPSDPRSPPRPSGCPLKALPLAESSSSSPFASSAPSTLFSQASQELDDLDREIDDLINSNILWKDAPTPQKCPRRRAPFPPSPSSALSPNSAPSTVGRSPPLSVSLP